MGPHVLSVAVVVTIAGTPSTLAGLAKATTLCLSVRTSRSTTPLVVYQEHGSIVCS